MTPVLWETCVWCYPLIHTSIFGLVSFFTKKQTQISPFQTDRNSTRNSQVNVERRNMNKNSTMEPTDVYVALPLHRKESGDELCVHETQLSDGLWLKKFVSFLGMFVGLLIQMSTLGVNLLFTLIEGSNANHKIIAISTFWSFGASFLVLLALGRARARFTSISEESGFLLECSFVSGALFGGWSGWIAIDIFTENWEKAGFSCMILAVCLLLLQVMFHCRQKEELEHPGEDSPESETEDVKMMIV